jgi:shikimate dehydrogenase
MPFKQKMGPHLVGMSPEAIATGSVNLLLRHDDGWIGENTDQEGFIQALSRRRLPFSRVLLLGNGGVARSIMSALVSMPFVESIQISCRREEAAQELIDAHDDDDRPVSFLPLDGQPDPEMDLLINATPLGMEGHYPDSMACPAEWLPQDGACFDLVSMPRETPLLKAAGALDMIAIPGMEMLVFQACRAFEGWTGADFHSDAIMNELGL